MAKMLSEVLALKEIRIGRSESLEIVARQFGFENWNVLASKLSCESHDKPAHAPPEGWFVGGSRPDFYDMGVERKGVESIAVIRRRAETEGQDDAGRPFGTLMQSILADMFIGGKVRFTASLRTEEVISAATIWLRIDDERGNILGFDNMEQREENGAVRRTSGWVRRSIVLDVPAAAKSVNFGLYLRGSGAVFARGLSLEAVDETVQVTEIIRSRSHEAKTLPLQPTNLGFS